MDRKKLETKIERETYKFINMIKESSADHVMLWANRNRVDIDLGLLQTILDQYKASIENEYMGKVDHLLKGLDKELTAYTSEPNPLPLTVEAKKPTRKNAKKSA